MILSCVARFIIKWLIFLSTVSKNLELKCLPHYTFQAHLITELVMPMWNHLPEGVKSLLNAAVFRSQLSTVHLSSFCILYPCMCIYVICLHTSIYIVCIFSYSARADSNCNHTDMTMLLQINFTCIQGLRLRPKRCSKQIWVVLYPLWGSIYTVLETSRSPTSFSLSGT